jgi:hypothetical protein
MHFPSNLLITVKTPMSAFLVFLFKYNKPTITFHFIINDFFFVDTSIYRFKHNTGDIILKINFEFLQNLNLDILSFAV